MSNCKNVAIIAQGHKILRIRGMIRIAASSGAVACLVLYTPAVFKCS